MIIIGSQSIKHYFQDFPREPKDIDILIGGNLTFYEKETNVETHSNSVLFNYVVKEQLITEEYLPPNIIYTLKVSHIFWDIKWEKHMFDIVFLKSKGCELIKPLFDNLYEYWKSYHGEQIKSNLSLSKDDFFNNALKTYDHDYLHTLINPEPMYKKVLCDGKDVEVSEEKFNLLTVEEKLELVREEIYVMAYERLGNRDYRSVYIWMLKKFIIHHAPLWEAIFIIENYKILHLPIINFKQKLDYGLSRNC